LSRAMFGRKHPPTFILDSKDKTPIAALPFPVVLGRRTATIRPPAGHCNRQVDETALAAGSSIRESLNSPGDRSIASGNNISVVVSSRIPVILVGLERRPVPLNCSIWIARRSWMHNWSFKKLHRLILTIGDLSTNPPNVRWTIQLAKLEPAKRPFCGRTRIRRLSGEEIHDCAIAASGEIGFRGNERSTRLSKPQSHWTHAGCVLIFGSCRKSLAATRTTTSPQSLR